jgi:hypothetical protein
MRRAGGPTRGRRRGPAKRAPSRAAGVADRLGRRAGDAVLPASGAGPRPEVTPAVLDRPRARDARAVSRVGGRTPRASWAPGAISRDGRAIGDPPGGTPRAGVGPADRLTGRGASE